MLKRQNGIYFTTTNPFELKAFEDWLKIVSSSSEKHTFLEPFAGENHIIKAFREVYGDDIDWHAYDIKKGKNNVKEVDIVIRDTLKSFPKGYNTVITNPPYLAKNSATRRGLAYPDTKHEDLYRYSLEIMLKNCENVAVIIPESFITNVFAEKRIYAIISLTTRMFTDTDCPSCLALFLSEEKKSELFDNAKDFFLYSLNEYLGNYKTVHKYHKSLPKPRFVVKFNDKNGTIGGRFTDNNKYPSIRFVRGDTIPPEKIKHSSRAITRISGFPIPDELLNPLIDKANEILSEYREKTHDIFLTSFKGLREDGKYRRRLDFATAKKILNLAYIELSEGKNEIYRK